MRITSVEAIPISVPRHVPMVATQGSIGTSEFGLVRIETDAEVVGWGEISMSFGRAGRSLCRDVELYLAPVLAGRDPRHVAGLAQLADAALEGAHAAKAGVQLALFDIVGKSASLPVYQLLGGRARDGVPVAWPIGWGTVEETVAAATWAVEQGFRTVKLKIGRPGSIDYDIVASVRSSLGSDVWIKVDANMAYRSAGEAYARLKPLEELGLQLIEQPLPARDLDELRALREKLATPLLLDESCWELRDVGEIVRREAADVLNIYVSEMGGLLQALLAFGAAASAGLVALIGSQCELGIGTAAGAHLGVCVPNLAYESDIVGVLRYPRDVVVEPPRVEHGVLYPPSGPGLGVEIDEEAVAAFRL